MNEFKGTKGKWKIHNGDDDSVVIVKEDKSQAVAFLPELFEDSEANAKLIACAPEMLEFLYRIESSENTPAEYRRQAKQLIKKATEL